MTAVLMAYQTLTSPTPVKSGAPTCKPSFGPKRGQTDDLAMDDLGSPTGPSRYRGWGRGQSAERCHAWLLPGGRGRIRMGAD